MHAVFHRVRRFALSAVALVLFCAAPLALAAEPLALFGTPLKGATRAELRQALPKAGLTPTRVDDGYFCDTYQTDGVPQGASQLTVCYTEDNNAFASAEYTFTAFMDTGLVKRVIDTVAQKYGRPGSVSGNYGLGNVTARWTMPQGMEIRVTRGWPDTTTYLDLIDRTNNDRMQAQMKAASASRLKQQAQKDSSAF